MDLIERFRYIMKLNNLTASAFANQIGVQPSSVSHILSGRNKPSLEFIQKILRTYPKVDSNWLINGTTSLPKEVEINTKKEVKEEEIIEEKETSKVVVKTSTFSSQREVTKVLIFYSDGTFEEFKSQ